MNLRILDKNLVFIGEIDNYKSATIERKYRDVQTITIKIDESKKHSDELVKGAFVFVDECYNKFFRIYRRKAVTQNGATIEVIGKSAMKFLSQRVTIPPTGVYSETYTAAADDIAKRYIKTACVESAITGMNIDFLSVAPELGFGTVITDETRYKYLDKEVQRLLELDDLGFKATFIPETSKIEIDIYRGADRSQHNTEGNSPVIFATKYDNLKAAEIDDSDLNTVNYCIVGGKGDGAARIIEYVENGTTSGLDRHCAFVNASSLTEESALTNKGKEMFSNDVLTVGADIDTNANQKYEEDFDLGDIVTVVVGKTTIDTRIMEITEAYEAGEARKINITFGDAPKTIRDTMKNTDSRLSELESN